MNELQHDAVVKVERAKTRVRVLSSHLTEAEGTLKRAEALLRRRIKDDPASWNSVSAVPDVDTSPTELL